MPWNSRAKRSTASWAAVGPSTGDSTAAFVLFQRAYDRVLAALGIIAVDNPMMAGTGHRICNDCMKSCIYQKQDPVNIPQAETRTLKDVLELPWGFEIYSLLTRWNPFDLRRPYPKAPTGKRVLVVGLGPAGFTVAHHLMNDGHAVVGIDGLKIEPLDAAISGVDPLGNRKPFKPIRDISVLREPLDKRVMAGFGGVAEYGITVRWDKNFLKIIRLLLERRRQFAMFGGVRFGGTLTIDEAFDDGFDHIALCAGAGRPTVLEIPNGFARGEGCGGRRLEHGPGLGALDDLVQIGADVTNRNRAELSVNDILDKKLPIYGNISR